MAALTRDGVTLSFDEAGSGVPPMVFVHGWCCDRSHFAPQMAHFSKSHRCVAMDLRGQGRSDKPEQTYSIEGHADDVAWLCGELGLEKPVVVGHSMGGAIALALAAAHPELPRGIVMLDGAILFPAEFQTRVAQMATVFRSAEYLAPLTQLVDGMFMESDDTARRAEITAGMLATPQHVLASEFESISTFDADSAAKTCTVPAMYIGSHAPVADMRRLRQLMPQLIPAQTAGVGHFHQVEAPDQVNAMIERFLAIT